MQIQVASLARLDIYRDGGSISASFFDEAIEYTLFFPVCWSVEGRRRFKSGYLLPRLKWSTRIAHISHITGLERVEFDRQEKGLSWAEARYLLDLFVPHTAQLPTGYADIFELMQRVASVDGKVDGEMVDEMLKK